MKAKNDAARPKVALQGQARPLNWKQRLRPYADKYAAIVADLNNLSTADLKKLRSAIKKADAGNCWWAVYGAANTIKRDVDSLIYMRRKKRSQSSVKMMNPQPNQSEEAK